MRLVTDRSLAAYAVRVTCLCCRHKFVLAEGYSDLDGVPFRAYYCGPCVDGTEYVRLLSPPSHEWQGCVYGKEVTAHEVPGLQ